MKFLIVFLAFLQFGSCANGPKENPVEDLRTPIQVNRTDGLKAAYFGSGCFWCVEAIFESVKGVEEVVSGYAGGNTKNPTYRQVGSGDTGHAEVVEVIYNPKEITFETMLIVYYGSQNPTTYGQAPDFGSAYRSVIFYQNDVEKKLIEKAKAEIQKEYASKKVRTEVLPFQAFYKAEDYHQDFERLNPNYPYVQRVSKPRLERFKQKFPELVK